MSTRFLPPYTCALTSTASSLPDFYKERLLKLKDHRISQDGVIVIKAQQYRSQEKNREEALRRLQELIQGVSVLRRQRRPTRRTHSSQEKRLDSKIKRGKTKALRRKYQQARNDSSA